MGKQYNKVIKARRRKAPTRRRGHIRHRARRIKARRRR